MKKDIKRIIVITMLIMVSTITFFFVSKELINKNSEPEINKVKNNKTMAIMISEDGSSYKEYEGEEWPKGYIFKRSECVDNNGDKVEEIVTYDEETNKITLKSKRTVYCTMYFDYKGTGEKELPYRIKYIEDLVELQIKVNSGETYAGKYFELEKDLDFNQESDYRNYQSKDYGDINGNSQDEEIKTELTSGSGWEPIGDLTNNFEGIFDGKEKTISNLYINNTTISNKRIGLFGVINESTIKNLTVSGNIKTSLQANMGIIIGQGTNSTIDNCASKGMAVSTSGDWSTGGIIGGVYEKTYVKNSHNEATITGGAWIGGIVGGFGSGNLTIEGSSNLGTITKVDDVNIQGLGGLVGAAPSANNDYSITIKNSQNKGEIKDRPEGARVSYVGGLIGRSYVNVTIEGSNNQGSVSAEGTSATIAYIGGLIGADNNTNQIVTITNSYNTGIVSSNVSQNIYVGGIIGYSYGKLKVDKCHNEGLITNYKTNYTQSQELCLGGFIGGSFGTGIVKEITNSYNNGPVKGGNRVAGFISRIGVGSINIIDRSYNGVNGEITADNTPGNYAVNAGGFIGYSYETVFILNSYNLGNVTSTASFASGFIGNGLKNHAVINSYNLGNINSSYNSSGILSDTTSDTKIYINNVYNLGDITGTGNKYGIGFYNMTPTIYNAYYKNDTLKTGTNIANNNVIGKLEKDIKSQEFVNTLNNNMYQINLNSIDPILNDYKLSGWILGDDGYPVFAKEIEDLSGNKRTGISFAADWTKEGITTSNDAKKGYVYMGLENYDFDKDLTFVVRVKFNKLDGYQEFFGNWDGAGGGFAQYSNKIRFGLYNEDLVQPVYVNIDSSPTISTNKWYTIVGTYDNKEIKLYINGNKEANVNSTGGIKPSTAFIALGQNPLTDSLSGIHSPSYTTFSDALIFDRALSEEEIKENYSGIPNPVNKDKLLLWYKF